MDPLPPTQTPPASPDSSTGLATNVASLLTYLLGFITGIIFLLVEKKDETVRWHAANCLSISIFILAASFLLGILMAVPFIGWLFFFLFVPLQLAIFVLWVVLLITAYQGKKIELPILSQLIPALLKIGV
jgi:uncharacterized membrane protein